MSLGFDKTTWQQVTFGDVVRNVNETVKDAAAAAIDRVIAMEHMDPGELKINRWGNTADGTTFTRRARPGQTLFGKRRAYQRKVAYAEFDAICSGDIYTFEADETRMLGEFLPFLVQSDPFFDHALDTSAGSLSPRTNWRDLADFELTLPPLDEQKRIVDLLWSAEHHLRALNQFKARLATAVQRTLSSHLAAGEGKLGDYADILVGFAFPSGDFIRDRTDTSRALLRGINVGVGLTRWDPEDTVHFDQLLSERTSKYLLHEGDVVVPMDRPFTADGRLRWAQVGKAEQGALLVQRVARLRPKSPEYSPLLRGIVRSHVFQKALSGSLTGSFAPHLAHGDFDRYRFDVLGQRETAAHVIAAEHAEARLADEIEKSYSLRTALMSRVFGDQ